MNKAVITISYGDATILLAGILLLEDELNEISKLSEIEKHKIGDELPNADDILISQSLIGKQKQVLNLVIEEFEKQEITEED